MVSEKPKLQPDIQESIKSFLKEKYSAHVDMTDVKSNNAEAENKFFGRALAAYILEKRTGLTPVQSAACVTDAEQDNGVDAIYYDQKNTVLWLVQTKFPREKDQKASQEDFLKFSRGVDFLTKLDFSTFNTKIKGMQSIITEAFTTTSDLKINLVFATAGGEPSDFTIAPVEELAKTLNDREKEEWVFSESVTHEAVWDYVVAEKMGEKLEVNLSVISHGESEDRPDASAVYGQVKASDIAELIKKHGYRIFSENIRTFLGTQSSVNDKIKSTLINNPEHFLFLNNGITAVCSDIRKSKLQGAGSKSFTFENFKIINGAQTSGTIFHAFRENQIQVDKARVLLKVICVAEPRDQYVKQVTISSNSQNKIEAIDFASLEPSQLQIETKLRKDFDVTYLRLRGEPVVEDDKVIPMEEAAFALCALHVDETVAARLKREKSLFWENTDKDPYTTIFNTGLNSAKVINAVSVYRMMKEFIAQKKLKRGREKGFSMSADYLILHLIFRQIHKVEEQIENVEHFQKMFAKDHSKTIESIYSSVWAHLETDTALKVAQLPKLFITPQKVKELKADMLKKGIVKQA